MKARYICLEGVEGVGKTTQTQLLVDALRHKGYSVLQTKEPGTSHIPLTMLLRNIMLDNQYDAYMTRPAREFISQAIRSIHLEHLIVPATTKYDFIVQDRGILSGLAYGTACGNDLSFLDKLSYSIVDAANDTGGGVISGAAPRVYDTVVYLRGDSLKGLMKAKSTKQEFVAGDAMESRGDNFITNVASNMDRMSKYFNSVTIDIDSKSIEEVHSEILASLGLEK